LFIELKLRGFVLLIKLRISCKTFSAKGKLRDPLFSDLFRKVLGRSASLKSPLQRSKLLVFGARDVQN
jgi:hypothetical protein